MDDKAKKTHWVHSHWRPMMGWMYFGVCIFDFIIAPIFWSGLQAYFKGAINSQWQPLTLQGAGLFHLAMGAIVGVTSYGRTREKISGIDPTDLPPTNPSAIFGPGYGPGVGTAYQPPTQPITATVPTPPNTPAPAAAPEPPTVTPPLATVTTSSATVVIGFNGKKAPPPSFDHPQ